MYARSALIGTCIHLTPRWKEAIRPTVKCLTEGYRYHVLMDVGTTVLATFCAH